MQPSHPDIDIANPADRGSTLRKVSLSALGAGLLVLALWLLDAVPILALLLGLLGLLVIALGQVKRPPSSLRHSLRAAAMVTARMDSMVDNAPPSSRHPSSSSLPSSRRADSKSNLRRD